MSCWDSKEIWASNDPDDQYHGHIYDNYPGCGSCSFCCYCNDYDSEEISKQQQLFWDWMRDNPLIYSCSWVDQNGYCGKFQFRSSSLERAREVAINSIYEWETVLVKLVGEAYYKQD